MSVDGCQLKVTAPGPVPETATPVGTLGGVVSTGPPAQDWLLIRQLTGSTGVPLPLTSIPTPGAEAPGASGEAQLGEVIV